MLWWYNEWRNGYQHLGTVLSPMIMWHWCTLIWIGWVVVVIVVVVVVVLKMRMELLELMVAV